MTENELTDGAAEDALRDGTTADNGAAGAFPTSGAAGAESLEAAGADMQAPASEPADPGAAADHSAQEASAGADVTLPGTTVAEGGDQAFDLEHVKRILETALLIAEEPLSVVQLRKLFNEELAADPIRRVLETLRGDWEGRGVELTQVASGWRFRARPELQQYLDRLRPDKPPRYSRAVMETLAIIAYRQPVTRGDIEAIRGVTVSGALVKTLEQRGWVEAVGHKEVPGRPALYATTRQFLDDLNLTALGDLPPLEDLGSLVEATTPQLPLGETIAGPDEEDAVAAQFERPAGSRPAEVPDEDAIEANGMQSEADASDERRDGQVSPEYPGGEDLIADDEPLVESQRFPDDAAPADVEVAAVTPVDTAQVGSRAQEHDDR